ncbi:MAG: ABC transporter permease [Lachnospiraceae bacterium]|nr:ABC transporter permease [Lachnospiraceae bacterium]
MTQSLKMALKSLAGNKLRALLTMLGIIIGVLALVVLVSLVNGATSTVTDSVSSLGSNLLTVTISDDKGDPIKLDTLTEWSKEEDIGQIAPSASATATIKYGSDSDSITVYGTTPSYYDVEGLNLVLGRFLKTTDVDNNNYICVINETTATDLIGYLDCVGEEISLDGMKFTVAGVLEDDDSSLTSVFSSGSMVAYIPYTTLLRLSSSVSTDITEFYVSAADGSDTDTAETAITALLMERFEEDEDAFTVSSQNVLEDTVSSITSILTGLLGGIAAISLIVGGIGIMNIMMVTVTERTREIGIRKAIGATRGVILRQFLMEAVVLCMIGCAIGIFLSWIVLQLASVVASSLSMSFAMNGRVVLISIVFCFIIGIVFGLYPANKAAKMKPIDALHYGG